MYKAVFLDLDGTLLDNEKNISEENKKAIKYAQSKGAYVCVCTGRQFEMGKKFKELAGADRFFIYSNGAGIYDCDNNEVLFSSILSSNICTKISELTIPENMFIRIDTIYGRYINNEIYKVNTEIVLNNDEMNTIYSNNEVLEISIGSLEEDSIKRYSEKLLNLYGDIIKIVNKYILNLNGYKLYMINIINKSASKGNAITGLCKYLKIDTKDVIAIGDDMNDISMIEVAGLGIAMGNAEKEFKKIANEITKTNLQNGVAEVLFNKF